MNSNPTENMVNVSIIIVNFNTFSLTKACIESVYKYTQKVDFEIIIVDNASTEAPAEKLAEFFPDIRLIKNKQNLGFSKACNIGIENSNGDYILLLNSDTELRNDSISVSIQRLIKQSNIGALSSQIEYPDGRLQYPAERFWTIQTSLIQLLRLDKLWTPQKRAIALLGNEFDHLSEIEADWIWGAFFLFPRKILDIFPDKKLDDCFFMYAEDMLWCTRIKKAGYKIIYFPEAKIIHHLAASEADTNKGENKYYTKILPNIRKTIGMQKSGLYAVVLFAIKALHYITLRSKTQRSKAIHFFRNMI